LRLLLDEMYPAVIAEQLRARGHDVASVHDEEYRRLEGAPDEEVLAAARADERVIVTENVPDFRRLEVDALARGDTDIAIVYTTNRQFPRGEPGTVGRLVESLHALMSATTALTGSIFLSQPPSS
jgi:predicted nuclease of predicted toxin-antitoxin system